MATVERSSGTRGAFYVKIDGERVLYIEPGKLGDNLDAIKSLNEEAKNYSGPVKTNIGNTELKLKDIGWFSTDLRVQMHSTEDPRCVHSTYKEVPISQIPDVIKTMEDFVDEESGKNLQDYRVGELRRLLGNKIV